MIEEIPAEPLSTTPASASKRETKSVSKHHLLSFAAGALLATVGSIVVSFSSSSWSSSSTTVVSPVGAVIEETTTSTSDHTQRELALGDRHPNAVWDCEDGGYSSRTLKLNYEESFHSLYEFPERHYEASSVIVRGDKAFAVMDNSWAIYKFHVDLNRHSQENVRFGDPQRELGAASGYEAIFHSGDTYYLVRESVLHESSQSYHAIIEEVSLHTHESEMVDQFEILRNCSTEFEFEGDSKGFEGVWAIHDTEHEFYLLALCEGNKCREKDTMVPGNGKVVLMKLNETLEEDNGYYSCQWDTVRVLDVPHSAYFHDYSAMSIRDDGYVAITSQQDSQVWVGRLLGKNMTTHRWNMNEIGFDPDVGQVFAFPKNENCETIYCNIEGIHWLSYNTLMAVSDKTHGDGEEDFRCYGKDQSIHVFSLP